MSVRSVWRASTLATVVNSLLWTYWESFVIKLFGCWILLIQLFVLRCHLNIAPKWCGSAVMILNGKRLQIQISCQRHARNCLTQPHWQLISMWSKSQDGLEQGDCHFFKKAELWKTSLKFCSCEKTRLFDTDPNKCHIILTLTDFFKLVYLLKMKILVVYCLINRRLFW